MTSFPQKVKKLLRQHGVWGCAKLGFLKLYGQFCNRLPKRRKYLHDYVQEQLDFDREMNVKTWQAMWLNELQIDSPNRSSGTDHDPSPVRFVIKFFDHLPGNLESFTFIDLGSGLGRSVFVAASRIPFRRVIGIEFSPELHRGALENLASCHRDRLKCSDIEFLCRDAGEYDFPPDPLVVHLFNPFGPPVLQKVLDHLTAVECYILYRNSSSTRAECLAVFEKSQALRCVWSEASFSIWVCQPSAASPSGRMIPGDGSLAAQPERAI